MSQGIPKPTIKKLDKERYVVLKSGEIRYFEEHETKEKQDLRETFNDLKGILRTNFEKNKANQVWITLTYAENMQDPEQLMKDFEVFWKRVKRAFKSHKLDYVAVAEPQERGAWHLHIMIKSDQPYLWMDNRRITQYKMCLYHPRKRCKYPTGKSQLLETSLWPHGASKTERLKFDDMGNYFVTYFTSLIAEDVTIAKGLKASKKVKKGARLHLYPKNFKLYRCSRGIIRPDSKSVKYGSVKAEYPVTQNTYAVDVLENDEVINKIQHETVRKPYEKGDAPNV
jgi:hypothetical protein